MLMALSLLTLVKLRFPIRAWMVLVADQISEAQHLRLRFIYPATVLVMADICASSSTQPIELESSASFLLIRPYFCEPSSPSDRDLSGTDKTFVFFSRSLILLSENILVRARNTTNSARWSSSG